MKTLAIILLAQFALVYTDVSHLTQNYLPPSRSYMAGTAANGMSTIMTFEQHELQELPEQIEYVQQLEQKPADVMDQQMIPQFAANMQYMSPTFQEHQNIQPKVFPMELMSKQMGQQQQQWQQATDSMPQMPHEMLSMQYMPATAVDTADMYPQQQSRQLYQQQLLRQPDMDEQRMDMLQAMHSMNIPAMELQPMTVGQHQHALAKDGYHYKTAQGKELLHRH